MLGLLFVLLLVFALADTVNRFNGPTKRAEPCGNHDWHQMVDTEGKDLSLICGVCKKTPSMISEEHVPNE